MPSVTFNRFHLFCSAAMALTMAAPAFAEAPANEATQGDEIRVVAQRQPYLGNVPLRTMPQSVQVLDSVALTTAGLTKLQTALDFVSGVARQNNFGGLFDSYAIRGFSGDENTASNYLLNGFNTSRGFGGARDASNIERIEVIKGPTSALFGRGDPGGAVNIVTKKPYFTTGAHFTVSGGSYNTYRGEGDINLPLSDRLAVRVTGAYERGDTFRDYISTRKYTFTPSVLFKIDDKTSLTYELEYTHLTVPFDRGVVAPTGNLNTIPRSRFLGEPGDGPITTKALGHQAQLQHDFSDNWSLLIGMGYRTSSLRGYSSEAELGASRQQIYVDGQTLTRQRRFRDYNTTDLTFRGELSGTFETFGLTNHVQIGADWDEFRFDQIQMRFRAPSVASQTTAARGNQINILNPAYGFLATVGPFLNSNEDDVSYGAYLQDQIDLTDRLKLRLGARYDRFEQRILNRIAVLQISQNKSAFSPTVGLSYEVAKPIVVYASFGKGFRPNTSFDFQNHAFAPEKTTSYEVGAKLSTFGGRLTGTVALYTMEKTNVLTADPINAGFSLALGKARSKGVEAQISGKLPAGFRIDLNYAYTDAAVAKDALDPNFAFPILKGDPLINIPKNSASALIFKDFEIGGAKASIGGGVNYVGRRLGETGFKFANGSFFYLPSYTLTRLMASISPTDHIHVSADVSNLFNVHYFPSSYSRLWVMPGAPRQFMVHVGYSF
jgi:iron complex outermembrane receptor protein